MMLKIVGLGNPLYGDDAFGLHVVEELKKRIKERDNVSIISLPTPSPWDIYEVLREGGYFIIVDAMEEGETGKLEIFPIADIGTIVNYFKTIHDININQVLDYLRLHDVEVTGLVVAVRGYCFELSTELSTEMKELVSKAALEIEKLISTY